MDMDSTLINEEGIDLLAEEAEIGGEVAALTSEAMAGRLDFYQSLERRVQLLSGRPETLIGRVQRRLTLTHGAEILVSTLKAHGWVIGVVSGGFHDIIDDFLSPLQLDFIRANRFHIVNGALSGHLQQPVIGPREKTKTLIEFASRHEVAISNTVAIGDGANDRLMLEAAGLGIAFCAKQALKEVADISIDERDLSLVLGAMREKGLLKN